MGTQGTGRKFIHKSVVVQFCTYSLKVVSSFFTNQKRTLLSFCKLHLRSKKNPVLSFLPFFYPQ